MSMYRWQWGPKHVGPGGPGHGGRGPKARSGTPTGAAEIHGNGSGTARVMSGFDIIEMTNLQRHQSKAEAGADPTPRPHAGTHPPIHPSTSPPTGGPDKPGVVANFLGGVLAPAELFSQKFRACSGAFCCVTHVEISLV